jgi:hypothetical protein
MKTARRITFVCSLVFCASPLGAEETKAGLALPTAAANLKITTEMPSQGVAKTGPTGKLGFLNRGGAIGSVLIAFGLVASISALVVIAELLRWAPEGYEDDSGFHIRVRRKRTKRGLNGGLSLANR